MATAFVDFAELKSRLKIEEVVSQLGLKGAYKSEQWRGPCPACNAGGERALAVNTGKQSYYCFANKKGGDLIAFAAHVRGVSQRDAALWLDPNARNSDTVNSHSAQSTVPAQRPQPQTRKPGFGAEAYAKTLDPAHVALEPLGVSSDTLRQFGAGYSSSGINRGRLALPVHDRQGV